MNCSVCGGETRFAQGINKNGKPYQAHFCKDKEGCGNVDWLKPNGAKPPAHKPKPLTNEPEIIRMLLEISRKQDEIKSLLESMHPATKIFKGTKAETPIKPAEEEF